MNSSLGAAPRVKLSKPLAAEVAEAFWTTVVIAVGGASAVTLNLLLPKILGPVGFGLVSNIQAVILFALGFVTLGAADALPRLIGMGGAGPAVPWAGIFRRVCLRVVAPVSALVAAVAGIWYRWSPALTLGAAVLLACTGAALLAGNILRAAYRPVAGQTIVQLWRFVSLPVVGVAALMPVDLTAGGVVAVLVAAGLLGAVPGLIAVQRIGGDLSVPADLLLKLRAESRAFVGINASLSLISYLDQLIIPTVLGLGALGHYAAVWWLVGPPFLLFQAGVGFTLLPRLRRLGDRRLAAHTLRTQVSGLLLITVVIAVAVGSIAPILLNLLYGELFSISNGLIFALVLCGVLRIFYVLPSSVVGAWGDSLALANLNRWGWPVSLLAAIFAWYGGVAWGLTGVALGVASGLALRLVVAVILAKKVIQARFNDFLFD